MKSRRDLRITWLSNGVFTNSGYATFSRDLLFRLARDKWPVAQVSNYGTEGYYQYLHGEDLIDERFKGVKLKVYPKMGDPYGQDAALRHSVDFKSNVLFIMLDWWVLNPGFFQELERNNIKVIPYLPIDQDPPPPAILSNLSHAHKIITFSKYGQEILENNGFASHLIVEGIDTEVFKPMDKLEMRKQLNLPPDAFLFGMIGANKENPPRKGYQEALEAFKLFSENHPEAAIFFHTQQINPGGGFPIMEFANYLGVGNRAFYLDQYISSFKSDNKAIAKEINMFDALLHPSQTEGFGLLIVESQSCGVPVIINRCTSQTELVVEGKTGEICEHDKPLWRSLNGFVYPADVKSLHESMERLYKKLKDTKVKNKIKSQAREHVVKNYNIDTLYKEKWVPFLIDLQDEILGKV